MAFFPTIAIALRFIHLFVAFHGGTAYSDSSIDSPSNYFIVPSKAEADPDPAENPLYTYHQSIELQWKTTYTSFNIGMFQGPFDIDTTVIHFAPDQYQGISELRFNKLGLNASGLDPAVIWSLSDAKGDDRNQFGFAVYALDGTGDSFHSHTFNLTNTPSSLVASSFSSSEPTPTPTSASPHSTIVSSSGVTTTSTTLPHEQVHADHKHTKGGSGLSKDEKIGIGVGVGLGVSLLVVVAGVVVFLLRQRRSQDVSEDGGITPVIEQPKSA